MFLKNLKLTNFRNYEDLDQEFNHLKTIIIGQNAQGKSNILEAINILAKSSSDRASKDHDLILWGKSFALINAQVEKKEDTLDIKLQINPQGRRKLKINGVAKKAPHADLVGNFFTVMFSADDMYLIKGSPSLRRKWIDSNLIQLNSKYSKFFHDYQNSVSQKNALLKNAFEVGMSKKELKDQLEIWNEQIVNSGSELISMRLEYLSNIEIVAKEFLNNISKNSEKLELKYYATIDKDLKTISHESSAISLKRISDTFQKSIEEAFDEELRRGASVIGPHRDDVIFLTNKKDAHSFASQGQQRSITLALKLAELKVIEDKKKETPVLLLDDVFAELDESRQDFLLHNLPKNIQIFITTTHISELQKELLTNAQILKIENGHVSS